MIKSVLDTEKNVDETNILCIKDNLKDDVPSFVK